MKAIHAYIRRNMTGRVLEALLDRGCTDVSVFEVRDVTQGLRREEYSYSTGHRGDGMLFILPVEQAVRIATGTHGDAALSS